MAFQVAKVQKNSYRGEYIYKICVILHHNKKFDNQNIYKIR